METKDFNLATTLVSYGMSYKTRRAGVGDIPGVGGMRGTVLYFIFEDTDEIKQLVEDFWNRKLLVEPLAYSQASSQLKSRIYSTNQ